MNQHEPTTNDVPTIDYQQLDAGVREYVRILRENGIHTVESCEGGEGHYSDLPWVSFQPGGDFPTGLRAVAIAIDHGLPVWQLQRTWTLKQECISGPDWELTFHAKG